MKKQMLCGALTLSLLIGGASASFTDITQPGVQQAAAVLNALGIMQGEGGDRFNPAGQLTRAQFCKLAVTALGADDVSAYQSYSIFPDVPASHWAAGYINAALKQADIRDKQIIRGFADGTFGPDQTISYGEVCTMLLRMLDYQVEDVGPFWPADYIAKAEALKLNRGVAHYGAEEIVRRGDAAVMLLNTLQTAPKKGSESSKLLLNTVAANNVENSILLATSETDSELRQGQARFYENGSLQTRSMADSLDRCLIGTRGTVLFDKTSTTKVRAFVPENADSEIVTVRQSYADRLETDVGKIKVPSNTPVIMNGDIIEYGTAWTDLTPDYLLNVFYDDGHQIELLSAATPTAGTDSFVYGTLEAVNLPQEYAVIKNGVSVDRSKIKQYDLVTLNSENKTIAVSDRRVTGYLESASPSYGHPSRITVLGREYAISDHAASYFQGMQYNDKVTLLLDQFGAVQAAYPASMVSSENIGVFTSNAGGKATVQLLAGVTASGALSAAEDSKLLGQLVRVSAASNGKLSVGAYKVSGRSEDWSVSDKTIGSSKVSPNVKIYEMVADNAPVTAISDTDLTLDRVSASKIRGTIVDGAGSVIAVVLDDVTGRGWEYGLAYSSSENADIIENSDSRLYKVTLKTFSNGQPVTRTYLTDILPGSVNSGPIGLPRLEEGMQGTYYNLPVKKLSVIDTVGLDAFEGVEGVKTASGYLSIPDGIGVYIKAQGKMISLREAKSNYTRFTLYGDVSTSSGALVHLIYAE